MEWSSYEEDYGFRSDIQWGLLTQVSANAFGGKVTLEKVMPYQMNRQPTDEELAGKLSRFFPRVLNT